MTDNSDKVRSLILAALMVFSVFAGTVALTGTAAAAVDGTNSSVTPAEVPEDTTNTHNITAVASGIDTSDSSNNVFEFSLPGSLDLSSSSVTNLHINEGDVTYDGTYNVDSTNNDVTVTLADESGATGDTVNVSFDLTNVAAPNVNGDTTGDVDLRVSEDGGSSWTHGSTTIETLTITDSPSDVLSATHYDNETTSGTAPIVELAFNDTLNTVDSKHYTVNLANGTSVNPTANQPQDGRIELALDQIYTNVDNVSVDSAVVTGSDNATYDVTFAPVTVEASNNKNFDSGTNPRTNTSAYIGSNIAVRANDTGVSFDFAGNVFSPTRGTGTNSQVFVIDSDDFSEGAIEVDAQDDGDVNARIVMENLGLSVSADDVDSDTDVTGTVEADDIRRPVDVALLDSDDEVVDSTQVNLGSSGDADFTLANQSAGNYTVVATDVNTGVEDDANVTISAAAEGAVSFTDDTYDTPQGGIANITLDVTGTTEGSLVIGQSQNSGYQANVTFVDDDEDGEVTIQFNSYEAGDQNADVVNAAGDDTATLHTHTDLGTNDLLAEGGYDLAAAPGHESNGTKVFNNGDADFSSLALSERSTDEMTLWTAPSGTDADALLDSATTGSTVAGGDWIVHQISATGLDGLVDGDFEAALNNGVNVSVKQTEETTRQNRQPKTLDTNALDNDELVLTADAENDSYYIAVDSSADAFERGSDTGLSANAGEAYRANFTVSDRKLVGGQGAEHHQAVNATFEIVEPTNSLDETPVNVTASDNQSITGTSTLAPGSEFAVTVQSTGDTSPRFYNNPTATVQDDGTWNVSVNFAEQSAGDTFSVRAPNGVSADGNVVEVEETETAEPTETATAEPTETATAEPTETATAEPTATDAPEQTATEAINTDTATSTSTPGFGVAVALVALLAAALLAGRRE